MDWNSNCFLLILITVQLFQTVNSESTKDCLSENCTKGYDETGPRVLSRRKRYLTFPEGSSLQLVFCLQTAAEIPIGDIFLYSSTLSLAWALPDKPDFFHMLKENKVLRRGDSKEILFLDDNGKLLSKVPYKRSRIINPVFAKRSTDDQNMTFKEKLKIKIDRIKMHEKQTSRDYLNKKHMDEKSIDFHRNNRKELYEKIEKLVTGMGRDGRQCVLRKLCETARVSPQQGTFLQELLTVLFTLPKGKEFDYEEHKEYDKAHTTSGNCAALYPKCDEFDEMADV